MSKRAASSETSCDSYPSIRITNGKIKGYHIFRIKCVVGMEVHVKRETGGVDEKALVCYVPQNLRDDIGNVKVASKSSGRSYVMREMAGRAMGRVQYFLNKTFVDLMDEGKVIEIKGLITGNPTTTKAPPKGQKWIANRQEGGGAFTPCEWILNVKQGCSIDSALAMLNARLKDVEEGSAMEAKVDYGTSKRSKQ